MSPPFFFTVQDRSHSCSLSYTHLPIFTWVARGPSAINWVPVWDQRENVTGSSGKAGHGSPLTTSRSLISLPTFILQIILPVHSWLSSFPKDVSHHRKIARLFRCLPGDNAIRACSRKWLLFFAGSKCSSKILNHFLLGWNILSVCLCALFFVILMVWKKCTRFTIFM